MLKRPGRMRVHVILDQPKTLDHRIRHVYKRLHERRIVNRGTLVSDLDNAPAPQRLDGDKQTTGPLARICGRWTFGPIRFHRDRCENIAQPLTGPFINTHDWMARVIRLFLQVKHIFQMPHEIARDFPTAPALDSPSFELVVLRAVLTDAREMDSTTAHSTRVSASHGKGPRP